MKENYSEYEEFILHQAELAARKFPDENEFAQYLVKQLTEVIRRYDEKHPLDTWGLDTKEKYLKEIYLDTYDSGYGLKERAWKEIDKIEDLKIFKYMLALIRINNREMIFWHWRIHFFETPKLWKYIIEEKNNYAINCN